MTEKEKRERGVENELASLKEKLIGELREGLERCKVSSEHDSTELLDMASDGELDDMAARIAEADSVKIEQIEEALRLLRSGDYGKCKKCGEEISKRRLKAIPFATQCIKCKEEEERERYGAQAASGVRRAGVDINLTDKSSSSGSIDDVWKEAERSDVF